MVPRTGLEPARLAALAPETSASTIPPPGLCDCKGSDYFFCGKFFYVFFRNFEKNFKKTLRYRGILKCMGWVELSLVRLALCAKEVAHQGGAFFGENACGYGGFGMEGGGG